MVVSVLAIGSSMSVLSKDLDSESIQGPDCLDSGHCEHRSNQCPGSLTTVIGQN
jgi:hypothetical protein